MLPTHPRASRILAVPACIAVAAAAFAQSTLPGQPPPRNPPAPVAAPAAPPGKTPLKIDAVVLRLDFDSDHKFGSRLATRELEGAYREGSVPGLAELLEREGKVTLLHRSEAKVLVGESIQSAAPARVFAGTEEPYLTNYESSGKNGEVVRHTTQSTVSSGTTIELKAARLGDGGLEVEYDIDFDRAFPQEVDDQTLIARVRFSSEGMTTLDKGDMIMERHTRDADGSPSEFIFVLRPEWVDGP